MCAFICIIVSVFHLAAVLDRSVVVVVELESAVADVVVTPRL